VAADKVPMEEIILNITEKINKQFCNTKFLLADIRMKIGSINSLMSPA
jgi:hypothetical protein